ncbi:beta family protein [Leptospira sp. mild_001]|uniref:beta family protein n=1 Tax=Leptospira sp. mild_001 TaxID=2838238 RepID=UPI001E475A49|nr:beta family protein [Leptospira sp. mild_001]
MKYVPFLKLKQNEALALKDLNENDSQSILPFFDIPKPEILDELNIIKKIDQAKKYITKYWGKDKLFYIDNYDIPDQIEIQNNHNYKFVLDSLDEFNYIPTVGVNRSPKHLSVTKMCINKKKLSIVALRLIPSDFEDYAIIKDSLNDIIDNFKNYKIHLILDNRIINDKKSAKQLFKNITQFLNDYKIKENHEKIILTGSSIQANIAEHVETGKYKKILRYEWILYNLICHKMNTHFIYRDYGVVSPDYTDSDIEPELYQNVATPKIFYAHNRSFHIFRGKAFKTSPRGFKQYFDIAKILVKKFYYRGEHYSIGDKFIFDKSKEKDNPSSQGNWYRMLNNSHITYVCRTLSKKLSVK